MFTSFKEYLTFPESFRRKLVMGGHGAIVFGCSLFNQYQHGQFFVQYQDSMDE